MSLYFGMMGVFLGMMFLRMLVVVVILCLRCFCLRLCLSSWLFLIFDVVMLVNVVRILRLFLMNV